MVKRIRRLRLKAKEKLTLVQKKAERRDLQRLQKAEKIALVDTNIEKELLDRLKLGTYSDLYEDLLNLNKTAFEKHIEQQQLAVSDSEEIEALAQEDIEDQFDFVFGEMESQGESKGQERKKKAIKKKKRVELLMEDGESQLEEEILN